MARKIIVKDEVDVAAERIMEHLPTLFKAAERSSVEVDNARQLLSRCRILPKETYMTVSSDGSGITAELTLTLKGQ